MKKFRDILILILFVVGIVLIVDRLTYITRPKENASTQDNFAALPRDSVDMVFVGTSHQFCSINTDLLYDEYGINSFMLATSAQTVPMTYYAVWEAIELQHPDVIVMEAVYLAQNFIDLGAETNHWFIDGMPKCEAKKAMIRDFISDEERIYYYLPIGQFHTRWKELKEDDYASNLTMPRGNFWSENVKYNWAIPLVDPSEKAPMDSEVEGYMDRIVELCKENNVKLILYTAPFNTLYIDDAQTEELFRMQRIFNGLNDYAKEKGIPYYNLFYEINEIGLKGETDYMDSQHLNCYGQEKLTRYMVEKGYLE